MSAAELPLWRVVLDTGRFGDWIHVRAETAEAATKNLTRTQRKKVGHVRRVYKSSEVDAMREAGEIAPLKGRRR